MNGCGTAIVKCGLPTFSSRASSNAAVRSTSDSTRQNGVRRDSSLVVLESGSRDDRRRIRAPAPFIRIWREPGTDRGRSGRRHGVTALDRWAGPIQSEGGCRETAPVHSPLVDVAACTELEQCEVHPILVRRVDAHAYRMARASSTAVMDARDCDQPAYAAWKRDAGRERAVTDPPLARLPGRIMTPMGCYPVALKHLTTPLPETLRRRLQDSLDQRRRRDSAVG